MLDTLEKTKLNKDAGDICSDHDEDCKFVPCPVKCWLYAPELGLCPLINGEKK